MSLLKKNNIKLNNGQYAKFSHVDDWHRLIYKFENRKRYCLLDEIRFFTITSEGEPDCPLKDDFQPQNIQLFHRAAHDQISLEDWENYFKPIENENEDGDLRFDYYKDAFIYAEKEFVNKPYQHIWSLVDGDDGKLILLNGYHKVNTLNYLVCNIPWGTGKDSDAEVYMEVDYEGNN